MKHIIKTLIASALLAMASLWTFGLPWASVDSELAGLASGADMAARRPAAQISTKDVEMSSYLEVLTAIGTSRAGSSVTVFSEVSGIVEETFLEARQWVEAGDVLLRLGDDVERIEVLAAQAQLASSRQTLERLEALSRTSGAVSQAAIQEAQVAMTMAQASADRAEYALGQRTIRAPISGRLSMTRIRKGDRLASGQEVVSIDDTTSILVSFALPERAVEVLEVGREVRATTPALSGRSFTAGIVAFDGRIHDVARTIEVEAEITNDDGQLLPGMSFSVHVERESEVFATVTASSLNWAREGARVWVAREGHATLVPVLVRMRQGDDVWIEGDIRHGDSFVIDGAARLQEGQPLAGSNGGSTDWNDARTSGASGARG